MLNSSSKKTTQLKGTLLVALSGLLYGMIGFSGTEIMKDDFTVSAMLFWRFLAAFVWAILFSIARKSDRFTEIISPSLFSVTVLIAILAYGGSSAFYFLASMTTGTGIAMVIFFAYPIFVVLFAFFHGNWRLNKAAMMALAAVIFGLILLKDDSQASLTQRGLVLALFASFSYAVYVYGGRYTAKIFNASYQTVVITLGNSLMFLLIALATDSFKLPMHLHTWAHILAIGIIGTAIPIQLLLEGLKYIGPVKTSILSVLEPITTVLIGVIVLHESLSLMQSIGIVIILLGAIFIHFDKTTAPGTA